MAREAPKKISRVSIATERNNIKQVFHDTVIDDEDVDPGVVGDVNETLVNNSCNECTEVSSKLSMIPLKQKKKSQRKISSKKRNDADLGVTHNFSPSLMETITSEEEKDKTNKTDFNYLSKSMDKIKNFTCFKPIAESTMRTSSLKNTSLFPQTLAKYSDCRSSFAVEKQREGNLEAGEFSLKSNVGLKDMTVDIHLLTTAGEDSTLTTNKKVLKQKKVKGENEIEGNEMVMNKIEEDDDIEESDNDDVEKGNQVEEDEEIEEEDISSDSSVVTSDYLDTEELYNEVENIFFSFAKMERKKNVPLDSLDLECFAANIKLAARRFYKKNFCHED
uniref:Uncharacterized protein n=1 Tax=Strongyloides stercoralis TaxID=6248 RepID=A0A0K0EHM8_STRER